LIKDSPTILNYISNVSGILPTTNIVTIEGLEGDTKYASRVVAHNEIGSTASSFNTLLETAETRNIFCLQFISYTASQKLTVMVM